MSKLKAGSGAFGNQWSQPEFDVLDRAAQRELIRKINDRSLSWQERDDAKNRLLLAHARLICQKVFGLTGGRIGINDRQSELFDSAAAYIKQRLSDIADVVEKSGISLATAVIQRLKGWAVDKIRRSDGQSIKHGKGLEQHPVTAIDDAEAREPRPDEHAIRNESLDIIKANVFEAVALLDGLEQAVIVSRFGLDGGEELPLKEVAELLDESLVDVQNAYRRAKDKLKKWLDNSDPKSDF